MTNNGTTIGILAVQGDFALHARMLEKIGIPYRLVKHAAEFDEISGLILPGGESTTMLKFLAEEKLDTAIRQFAAARKPIFGTCAGAILLAQEVLNPPQERLGLIDITVERNGYGRQIDSSIQQGDLPELADHPVEMVFIRAPIIRRVGKGVRVLGRVGGQPVLVEKDNVLAATFHPELTQDETIHRYFISKAH
ncbi:MAG TPA: pyridoxal 5'-phosphate synthase glutaminase subunit PdxT [Terriglobia bacterium]|nr:pyridoxal 5'-phosphate synthase glutaminase subunit PdxT [Terriglobia bacterium]